MRVAVAGLGYRMANVLKSFHKANDDLTIVGLVDPVPAGLEQVEQDGLKVGPRFESVDGMLKQVKPDLLTVGSPNALHLDHIRSGLQHGVKVFTEKPVVIDEQQTLEMARLLGEFGIDRVLVGLVLRYSDLYRDLRNAQAQGQIGNVVSIEASEHIAPYHGAFFMRDWRRYQQYAGPYILEKCCHDIDLYASVVGARASAVSSFGGRKSFVPDNAPAVMSNVEREQYYRKPSGWNSTEHVFDSDADIIDYQTALIEYETGATMAFHANLNVPNQFRRFCVIGAKGMAEGDFVRNNFAVHDAASGEKLVEKRYAGVEDDHYGADDQMAFDITRNLREGEPLPVGILDALEAGLTAIKIDEARRTRKTIELAEIWNGFDEALRMTPSGH
ncbi:Gfo/Idh/MocA family protein [Martelella endophytica]|uniref:Oxidoreductase n=1 Tax=Martelella endophytica TaxID=1486262 RepID=A0A0D5LMQ0_MAREN|nr:Gfo/Idh/MocA family oxidoreductase [Martelella endophytica]AJY45411.1 oxidoreductase [Martelella endophytica]